MRVIVFALSAAIGLLQGCYAGGVAGGCNPVTVTCVQTTTEFCTITETTTDFCTVTQLSTCTVSFTTTTTLTYSSCPVPPPCASITTTTATTTTTTTTTDYSKSVSPCTDKTTITDFTTTTDYSTTKYEPTTTTTSTTTTDTTTLPPGIPNGGIVGIGLGAAFAGLAAALLLPFLFTRKPRTDATQTASAGE